MLSERRDPNFDHETRAVSYPQYDAAHHARSSTPRFARFVSGVQLLGAMLGIPLALASGYSIYHVNFSPEATCGALRINIISMLDQNADATTLRRLVRRDVASFERACGSVDPDAVAAFKKLLAKPQMASASERHDNVSVKQAVRRPAAKEGIAPHRMHEVAGATATRTESEHRVADQAGRGADARRSKREADADWLSAVRQALIKHGPATRVPAAETPTVGTPPAEARPVDRPPRQPPLAHARVQDAPPRPTTTIVSVPTPAREAAPDHPVPPALISNVGQAANTDHPMPPALIPNNGPTANTH
jgi:hypothetical protein